MITAEQFMENASGYRVYNSMYYFAEPGDPTDWDPKLWEGNTPLLPSPESEPLPVVEIDIGADLVEKLWGPDARKEWEDGLKALGV